MARNIIQRSFLLLAAALITLCATAAGKVEVTGNTSYGTVTSQANGAVVTITVTPASGYYIRKSDITATRTFMPSSAEARRRGLPIADPLTLVGNDPDDLSQARTYTVTLPGEEYDILLNVSYQKQPTITESMVTLSESVFVYNQQVQHPTVLISGLIEGRDYTVSYSDAQATEPGTYTLTVNGYSVWKGSVSRSYKIFKGGKAEVNTSIQGGIIAAAVDGQTVTLTVTPTDGYYIRKQDIQVAKTFMPVAAESRRTIPITDLLTLEGDDPSDLSLARTYTAQLPGWEYSAYVDATFTQRSTVTSNMVSLSPTTFIYNGEDQKPAVTVLGLTEGVDYLVHFEGTSWADVATYTVTVTGRSTWKGSVSKTWTITKAPAEVTRAPQPLTLIYNGQPQTLAEAGDCIGGTMLFSLVGSSFDTVIPTGTDAKTYTLYYKVQGDANHTDTETQSITVTIGKKAVTVSGITAQDKVYDGTTDVVLAFDKVVFEGMIQGDALTITAGGAFGDAQAGTDKVVSISNLVLGGQSIGNYRLAETGNQTEARAAITPKDIAGASFAEIPAQGFTGATLTPAVEVTLDGVSLRGESDYTVSYSDNVNAGTATVTVTGMGNYQGSAQATFAITAGGFENVVLTTASVQIYTGEPIEPKVIVTLEEEKLEEGTDYTLAYANNTEIGTATIIVTGTGRYSGSKEMTFLIEKPQPMVDENQQEVTAIVVENEEGNKEAVLTELPENFWGAETSNQIPLTIKDEEGNSYTITEVAPQAFKNMPSSIIYELPANVNTTEGVTNVINGDGTCETLDLTEVSGYSISKNVEVEEVVYVREVSDNEQAFMVCMPYDCNIPEGYEAYTFEIVDGQIMFNKYIGILQAYWSYMLKRVESSNAAALLRSGGTTDVTAVSLGAKNVTITPQTEEAVSLEDYELCGTVHTLTHGQAADMRIYTLQPDMTWIQSYSTNPADAEMAFLKPFQAYMLYKGAEEKPVLKFDTKGDTTTLIREVSGQPTTQTDIIYNMQGIKVDNPAAKGLYIVNGKKAFIKP